MVWIRGSRKSFLGKDIFKLRSGGFEVEGIAGFKTKLKKSLEDLINRKWPCGRKMEI